MNGDVAVLVSAGRHPSSGRARRAAHDARALELALRLNDRPLVLYAGDPEESALRDYLGMGIEAITVLACPADGNVIPCLVRELARRSPRLVLTGARAEHGPGTGYLPYAIAEALGAALVPVVTDVSVERDTAVLTQALARGRRRRLRARLPGVVTVDHTAPAPRQPAYAATRRGRVEVVAPDRPVPQESQPETRPARRRPRRLRVVGGSARERLEAARRMPTGKGEVIHPSDSDEAARAIYRYLVDAGMVDTGGASERRTSE